VSYLYIIAGAVAGAPLRYFIGSRIQSASGSEFPWGTFAVNVSGCLAIGVAMGLAESRDLLSREARLLLITGFLGSYTTFSAFGWETYGLLRSDDIWRAVANAAASIVLGVLAAWAGVALARLA
jgi:CrcB protein